MASNSPQWVLISSEFLTGVSGKHVGRATRSSAYEHLALCASLSLPRRGRALKAAEERSARAYCGELFTHRDTSAKSSSPCCMVAVLMVCKHFSTVWFCALIPNYSPSRWCIEWICIHDESERKWQDKTILMTEVIFQILITLRIGIDT